MVAAGDTRRIHENVSNVVFLGKNPNACLCYNPGGSYSALTGQCYRPDVRRYETVNTIGFPLMIENVDGTVTISNMDKMVIPFRVVGDQIGIAFKNVAIKLTTQPRAGLAALLKRD